MEAVRRYDLSPLLLVLLLLVAVAGLAFIFGLFRDLADSSGGAGFLEAVTGADGSHPLGKPGFLVLIFSLGVLVVYFLLSQSRKLHWLAAALFALLLLLIGTPLAAWVNAPDLDIGKPVLLENGLNVQLDQGGVVTPGGGLADTGEGGTSGEPTQSLTLLPEGGHQLSNTPVFRVSGAGHTSYLRVLAATDYDGRVWTVSDDLEFIPLNTPTIETPAVFDPQVYDFGQRAEDNITLTPITSFGKGLIPTALNISHIGFPAPLLWNRELVAFQSQQAIHVPYVFTRSHFTFPDDILRSQPVASGTRYLQLPDAISDRVRQLARDITVEAGATSPYEKAKALEQYLKTNYAYDLDYTNAPEGWEPSDWFLFEDQRGVCANFNHAFVVMARSLGLPARPVAGWAIAPTGDTQIVRAKQAHMWAEILFEDMGWITFDATGAGGPQDRALEVLEHRATPTPTAAPLATPAPEATPAPYEPTPTPASKSTPTLLENGVEANLEGGGAVSGVSISPEGAHEISETPLFRVDGATNTSYLRVIAANTYDGTSWHGDFLGKSRSFDGDYEIWPTTIDREYLLGGDAANIYVAPLDSFAPGFLPTSKYAVEGKFSVPVGYYENELLFQSFTEYRDYYAWTAVTPNMDKATLNSASVATYRNYVQLPDTIPDRVRELAQEVTREAGAVTPYEKAKALEEFLKANYTYDLGYTNAPEGWEPSDWFLFGDRRGVCANFNHAFVVMARSLGLPARPVAGWAIAPIWEKQIVRAKQAHQWAEVLFEDLGWVRFDATGAGGAPDRVREELGLEPTPVPEQTSTPTPTPPSEGELLENGVVVDLEGGGSVADPAVSPEGAHHLSETPVFRVEGAINTSYLRVIAANTYDGAQWQGDFQTEPGGHKWPEVIDKQHLVEIQPSVIEATPLTAFAPGFLPTSKYTIETAFPVRVDYYETELLFRSSTEFGDSYVWEATAPILDESTLNSASVSADQIYIQLPDTIPNRVRELALQVIADAGAETAYEIAKALKQYLKTNYDYDLDYASAPQGWEASDWFLFEEQRGVCANFNHAFVVMARSLGLPARPVAGWAIAPIAEEQIVRQKQAHQWAEVLFEELGWVRFDATASGGPPDRVRADLEEEPTPTPGPEPIETTTEITALDASATKGGEFTVAGTVRDSQGRPVDGMSLEIFINETKEHGGILLGEGRTSNGTFEIVVQVPTDIPVGEYQVLAHALPSAEYLDSWSDPPIIIRSETETTLQGPDSVLVGSAGAFTGTLREQSGEPLDDHEVQLLIDSVVVATTRTSPEGEFSFEHTFMESRETTVTAHFPGTELFLSSQAEHRLLVVVETSLTLEAPKEAYMENPVPFWGELRDMFDNPIADGEIVLHSSAEGEMGRAVTDDQGAFSLEHTFLKGGSYTVRAEFPGTTLLLPSSAETTVDVFINTILTLEPPANVNIEQAAVFTGTLTDTFDTGLGGQSIHMSVDGQPDSAAPATTDASGEYQWSTTFEDEGEVRIDASFRGEGLYRPSEAMAIITVMVPTSILLELPDYGVLHHETTLAGVLKNSRGKGLSGLTVSIGIDDLPPSTVTTDGEGRFTLQHTFTEVGSSLITAEFAGDGFLLPSRAEEILQVFTVAIEPDVPDTLVRGETTAVGGRLTLDDAPLTGEPITLLWDDEQVAEVMSQDDGVFSYDLAVDPSESLEPHLLTLSVPGFHEGVELEVAVKARTSLAIAGPLEGNPDDTLEFNATLLDDSDSPIPQLPVSLDEHPIAGVTDGEGVATLSYMVPQEMEAGPLSFVFRFEETDQYLGSEASLGVDIVLPPSRLWIWLTAALVPAALLALGGSYYLYRRRPRPAPSLEPSPPPEPVLEPASVAASAPAGRRRLATALYIELPQIVSPLPSVWGVGEPLEIRVTLRDENQVPVPDHTVEVSLEDERIEFLTDTEGVCTLEHTFPTKGAFTISATTQDDTEYKGTSRQVSVRVVDYREEVVQLYNDSLQALRRDGLQLRPESTPREVEHLVRQRWNSGSEVHVGQMVDCFEEADYSLHEIHRANYVRMYLACRQLSPNPPKDGLGDSP